MEVLLFFSSSLTTCQSISSILPRPARRKQRLVRARSVRDEDTSHQHDGNVSFFPQRLLCGNTQTPEAGQRETSRSIIRAAWLNRLPDARLRSIDQILFLGSWSRLA